MHRNSCNTKKTKNSISFLIFRRIEIEKISPENLNIVEKEGYFIKFVEFAFAFDAVRAHVGEPFAEQTFSYLFELVATTRIV